MLTIQARNVNDAFHQFKLLSEYPGDWNSVAPRGRETLEFYSPVVTEYTNPMERVLFDAGRDANPFFHFFESLWILAGRKDVAFLEKFNPRMKDFSDDGTTFHAAYGHRLRAHFTRRDERGYIESVDQLQEVIKILKKDPGSRQAVMCIWDPAEDLNSLSKDIPCNDIIFFKLRGNKLKMLVSCRSNDVIWGAYGTNVVQFSMVQEFVARAIGVDVGVYRQVSDSYHVYPDEPAYQNSMKDMIEPRELYEINEVAPYPLFTNPEDSTRFLYQLDMFMIYGGEPPRSSTRELLPFFKDVVMPMMRAWNAWRAIGAPKGDRIAAATVHIMECQASDWRLACRQWLERRKET